MITVAVALIIEEDRILIGKRKDGDLAGKWEFPGGKVEENETPAIALIREVKEELEVEIDYFAFFHETTYEYDFGEVHLQFFKVNTNRTAEKSNVHAEIQWVDLQELQEVDLLPADREVVEKLLEE